MCNLRLLSNILCRIGLYYIGVTLAYISDRESSLTSAVSTNIYQLAMFVFSTRNIASRVVIARLRNGMRRGLSGNAFSQARRAHNVFTMGGMGFIAAGSAFLLLNDNKILAETTKTDWKKLKEEIIDIMEDEAHDDGSYAPIFIRLAWHSAGTYCKHTKTGGSEGGTMRFKPESDHDANAGLHTARNRLEALATQYPGVSHADLYIYAGKYLSIIRYIVYSELFVLRMHCD